MAKAPTELTCDMAETYGVLDYRGLPVETLAALCAGLRDDSRTKMKFSGATARPEILLLAAIADRLGAILYGFSQDAKNGTNKPVSLVALFTGESAAEGQVQGFDTEEELEAALHSFEEVKPNGR